jgi:glycerol-1-phosphate dehydrogenase [NAD(P)+]
MTESRACFLSKDKKRHFSSLLESVVPGSYTHSMTTREKEQKSLTSAPTPPPIPTCIDELLGFCIECPCGVTHRVDLQDVSIRAGALDDLPDFVRKIGTGLTIAVTADRVTEKIAGDKIRRLMERAGHKARLFTIPDGDGGRPHANEHALNFVSNALKGADLGIAAGSGTVNDLTKLASFELNIPYMAAATAPSMNGYTSAIAAMMFRGVKRTVPCAQPAAVAADLDILKDAPLALIAAGLGDLESKPTATADYRLGAAVRKDAYCKVPESTVLSAEERAANAAAGLPRRDAESVAALTEALILSGISMKLAGSSSPASGGEHLISHLWDMTAAFEGRVEGFHGAQVGVATIVTAALYEHLKAVSPDDIDPMRLVATRPSLEEELAVIREMHKNFAPEVAAEYRRKRPSDEALQERLVFLKDNWALLFQELKDVLRPSGRIRDILKAAGAPTSVQEINLDAAHLQRALRYARHIRDRYTVLDLAFDIGILGRDGDAVLQKSGCIAS